MIGTVTSSDVAPVNAGSIARFLKVFPIGRFIGGFVVCIPVLLAGLALGPIPTPGMPWSVVAVLIGGSLLLPPLMVLAVVWMRSAQVEISETRLRVASAPFGPSVLLASLRSREARIVDLVTERGYRPTGLMFGANIPGCYTAGSGSLRMGERARWLLTDVSQVVYIPGHDGPSVLLSVSHPEGFVAALQAQPTPSSA